MTRDGFYADTRDKEMKCPDLEINVLQEIIDVTKEVNAAVKPEMRPSYSWRRPYMSTSHTTRWPMRRSASCVSLKLASIQISVSDRTAIRPCPIWT